MKSETIDTMPNNVNWDYITQAEAQKLKSDYDKLKEAFKELTTAFAISITGDDMHDPDRNKAIDDIKLHWRTRAGITINEK